MVTFLCNLSVLQVQSAGPGPPRPRCGCVCQWFARCGCGCQSNSLRPLLRVLGTDRRNSYPGTRVPGGKNGP
eukprot:365325-Rhodomonas_salina.1